MNFDFQSMKSVIAREFDRVMEHYPTDMTMVAERVPVGGDPLERKLAIVRAAEELCPVHLFDHYP